MVHAMMSWQEIAGKAVLEIERTVPGFPGVIAL